MTLSLLPCCRCPRRRSEALDSSSCLVEAMWAWLWRDSRCPVLCAPRPLPVAPRRSEQSCCGADRAALVHPDPRMRQHPGAAAGLRRGTRWVAAKAARTTAERHLCASHPWRPRLGLAALAETALRVELAADHEAAAAELDAAAREDVGSKSRAKLKPLRLRTDMAYPALPAEPLPHCIHSGAVP